MLIAIVCDTHYGARSDSTILLDNQKQFFDNTFFPTLKEKGVNTVIHLGDLVDRRKYINFNTSKRMRTDFLNPLQEYTVHMIVGNHDVFHKNTNEVNALQELLNSYSFDVYTNTTKIVIDGSPILLVPWITTQNESHTMQMIDDTKAQICMGHFELSGFEFYKGVVSEHGMSPDTLSKFDLVFSGHYHQKSSKGNIHYLGAPYPMTWADYDCPRGFHLFDTNIRELTFIANPYSIFTQINYDDTNCKTLEDIIQQFVSCNNITNNYCKVIVKKKSNPYLFDLFINELEKQSPNEIKIIEHSILVTEETTFDQAEDTISILRKTIDGLDVEVNKPQLQDLFSDLYQQASNMEI
jgi:DNA repair exonuclease SbcCD nuclease subunit